MPETPPKMDFTKELVKGLTVHPTLNQEILVTTSDKLRLCLQQHQSILAGRTVWIAPLGVLLALLCALLASDFRW
jgi:hypothetical protein